MTVERPKCSAMPPSPVYGPVHSWRFGNSLGVDMIYRESICSFNCVYCQLGEIRQVVDRQEIFVPTERIVQALDLVNFAEVDVVTFSGSGEPTLALNIGEIIDLVRQRYHRRPIILTNSTWLHDAETRKRLRNAAVVDAKLDAASDEMLRKMNRPAPGITMERIVEGIRAMRREPGFHGRLVLQTMFMPINVGEAEELARIIGSIQPDEVQLNTPRRPRPREWTLEARGRLTGLRPQEQVALKTISPEQAEEIEEMLRARIDVPIRTVYPQH